MATAVQVKKLVAGGQVNFVNGGWVQHDEAAAHFVAMIDQTTRGHLFLKQTFNVTPTVGWQIDPFGHSSTQVCIPLPALALPFHMHSKHSYQRWQTQRRCWSGVGLLHFIPLTMPLRTVCILQNMLRCTVCMLHLAMIVRWRFSSGAKDIGYIFFNFRCVRRSTASGLQHQMQQYLMCSQAGL